MKLDEREVTSNVRNNRRQSNTEEEYKVSALGTERTIKWTDWQGRQKSFPFVGESGVHPVLCGELANGTPLDFFPVLSR